MSKHIPFRLAPEIRKRVTITADGDLLSKGTPNKFLDDIKNFEVRPTDVFVITWPRSGTTWTQYIVSQIVHGQEFTDKHNINRINYFIEMQISTVDSPEADDKEGIYKMAENGADPRLLKSHLQMKYLPTQLFTKRPKVIYVARNPKDAAVSYYNFTHLNTMLPNYGDWSEFYEYFHRGLIPYGDWFEHVLSWWGMRHEPNVMFLRYEDMIKDTKQTVLKLSNFLERPLSKTDLDDISRRSEFGEMSKNRKANNDLMNNPIFKKRDNANLKFMRKGIIGDWQNYFTMAQNNHFNTLFSDKMCDTGLTFDFVHAQSSL
ncbi:sulfotransferase 1C2-like [Apostichopus japonicus]|uniref:sulfotransferase 1C2-like n=1 Tax=Stichopus japonicus TaxID=307972 RepID=UPI003AB3B737